MTSLCFRVAEPKPFAVTGDVGSLVSSSIGLALRLGAGAFVTGWNPELKLSPPSDGDYALSVGPFHFSDTSDVMKGKCPRPTGKITVYEFDSSPFCRKVRDACTLLDLEVIYKPCPGAASGFSEELFAATGRRTVPYLIDEGRKWFTSNSSNCCRIVFFF